MSPLVPPPESSDVGDMRAHEWFLSDTSTYQAAPAPGAFPSAWQSPRRRGVSQVSRELNLHVRCCIRPKPHRDKLFQTRNKYKDREKQVEKHEETLRSRTTNLRKHFKAQKKKERNDVTEKGPQARRLTKSEGRGIKCPEPLEKRWLVCTACDVSRVSLVRARAARA